ncbi:MAG: tRNA glutamyl-Q(34) synthetase GluQRS [Actinomycetota bacterium]
MPQGRFAPSPTGRLHVGNLRTALVAWLAARVDGSDFLVRFEDLDTASVRDEHYESQLADLAAIGLDWDGEVVRQSDRMDRYREALDRLVADDAAYPCFCSRREIREAAAAPNAGGRTEGRRQAAGHGGHRYPGTCRDLSSAERAERATTRPPALRFRADGLVRTVDDHVAGPFTFELDDFVIQRNDGVPAYHLVVVVDDAAQGIELVVRADDLLESAARQLVLYERLGLAGPQHAHVPLVLGPDGNRLAKRHGAVDLDDRAERGQRPDQVLGFLAVSLGLCDDDRADAGVTAAELVDGFDVAALPRHPLTLPDEWLA